MTLSTTLPALVASSIRYRYDASHALDGLDLSVASGDIFALLGPNGSGKTTLFRLISTLAMIQEGEISVFGHSVRKQRAAVRSLLGVVFQNPSLDPKLTVEENIRCQAALYGISGQDLRKRIQAVSEQLGLEERLATPAEKLSGGFKRRAELAKGILHQPKLLLLDEPSTGLDPASRLDLWHAIQQLRTESGVTVLLTTHLLEEADKADRIAILDRGAVVAEGPPAELRASLGNQVLSIRSANMNAVIAWLEEHSVPCQKLSDQILVSIPNAMDIVAPLSKQMGDLIQSITLGQPSLEDVFIAKTGHRFWKYDASVSA